MHAQKLKRLLDAQEQAEKVKEAGRGGRGALAFWECAWKNGPLMLSIGV